jgi:hypothetical protein
MNIVSSLYIQIIRYSTLKQLVTGTQLLKYR